MVVNARKNRHVNTIFEKFISDEETYVQLNQAKMYMNAKQDQCHDIASMAKNIVEETAQDKKELTDEYQTCVRRTGKAILNTIISTIESNGGGDILTDSLEDLRSVV